MSATVITATAGLLYLLTAARDITVGDSPELITVAVTLGVAHPPGYPLFTMLGHLFSLLPLGHVPFRVNLLSVTCDALTAGVVFLTVWQLCRSQVAAAMAALVLVVNATFWTWSLVAEVFPLNNLLASLFIYALVRWQEKPEQPAALIAAAFVAGLGLANHQTIVLLGPACAFVVWHVFRRCRQGDGYRVLRARHVLMAGAAFLLGLLPYLYVPWASARHPEYNWGNVSSLHDLIALVARRSYGSAHLVSTPGYSGGSALLRILALLRSIGWLGCVLALAGLIQAYRRQRWYFWFVLIAFICVGPFFVAITNLNFATAPSALFVLQRFFLLSHVVIAPLYAFGFLAAGDLFPESARRGAWRRVGTSVVLLCLAAITAFHHRRVDQSRNTIARTFGDDMFATVEPGSILIATGDGIALPLVYLQQVERTRRDVTLVLLPLLAADWYVGQLRARYRDLHLPFDRYDAREKNLRTFVEANPGRLICLAGSIGNDASLNRDYWPRQHGLVAVVEPKSKRMTIDQLAVENEPLLRRYRPPLPQRIRPESFEKDILDAYAWPAFRLGDQYERAGAGQEARAWYARALSIDPYLAGLRAALARTQ